MFFLDGKAGFFPEKEGKCQVGINLNLSYLSMFVCFSHSPLKLISIDSNPNCSSPRLHVARNSKDYCQY